MKKLVSVLIAAILAIALAPTVEAQYRPLSRICCDVYDVPRCELENWTPIGNPCFCYGQGWGHAC